MNMVASTDIKFYVHSNNNAPQLQNAYGSMIRALDACLVNGISLGSVSTLTAVGTTVTAVFSNAHNLMQYQVLKITGANQAEYNGEHRILTVPNATSVTFQLASAPSVTTATGTIIASLPPLGWEKPFSSTNVNGGGKAAYRSKNTLLPSRPFLRVVDELDPAYTATYAKFAKVGIVEDMTDINTMLGVQAPFDPAFPDKNWIGTGSGATAINGWARWYYSYGNAFTASISDATTVSAGNRAYIVVGSGDYFYILPCPTPTITTALCFGFGAFKSTLNNDSSCNFLSACNRYAAANVPGAKSTYTPASWNGTGLLFLQRSYNQAASPKIATNLGLGASFNLISGSQNYVGSTSLSTLTPFTPVFINEDVLRGEMPGLYWLYQAMPYLNYQVLEQEGALYIAVNCAGSASEGQILLKIGDL
jgi:hypothetical protein